MTHSSIARVVSFNLHKGRSIAGTAASLPRLAHLLRAQKVDVALMQEVSGATRLGQDHLGQLRGGGLSEQIYGANVIKKTRHHGNAIFAKPDAQLELVGNFDISAHKLERRGLLMAKAVLGGRPGTFICAHLALTKEARTRQVEMVNERIAQLPSTEWIVMGGDFNCWGESIKNTFEKSGLVCASLKGGKTFPSVMPIAQLDKIFVRNCALVDSGVLDKGEWRRFSDHLPIWADINFE